ncbi:MAG: iron-sulfur cluster repair di-iron protein [Crocinitomicaceae bacterium]
MQELNEAIIDVQSIEPRLRHQTIFQEFHNLRNGESFIIHNNHDPKPVYYQLIDIFGEVFTWDYLQAGPEWWDIRVTKTEDTNDGEEKDLVLNVPAIEPQFKHETIFNTFKSLRPGNSFIIHNDHDPKPVYYQLINLFGETFTWEYLQQGPQWFDIRVTKNGEAPAKVEEKPVVATNVTVGNDNEKVVDVPSLEPRLKHPTIFQTFDTLQAGESMVIHNDHDPKPVYYQLLSERGDVFTWEYLQQGPQWWDIRVTRKGTETTETIGEIVAKDLRKAEVFKKFGIDFCCGGKKTVRQVCAEKGIDPTIVEQELQKPVTGVTSTDMNYTEWDLDFLADYIVNKHHKYVRKYLPEIVKYATKVAQVHGGGHPELHEIKRLFDQVDAEMSQHMIDEEQKLFPLIKEIVRAKEGYSTYQKNVSFADMVAETEKEHDSVGRALEKIRELSANYTIPEDACTSYKLLFAMLQEFENDLFTHIHLENNILFVKAAEVEKSL